MEQGPVLIVTFIAQQIIYVEDSSGKVIEGDKVIKSCFFFWRKTSLVFLNLK